VLGNIEDHAVRILELALEVAVPLVARSKKNLPPAASIFCCVSAMSST